ncbi:MAG: Flp pilus assembly complex ATPase component TadA [Pirellulaceae bacterium]|nr:Flp pilus assembly complex ATPase component TadA [Pirellulaceae bacterium]
MEASEILLRRGLIDQSQLDECRETSRLSGKNGAGVVEAIVDLGFLPEEDVLRALGEELGVDFIDLADAELDLSLLKSFPHKLIHRETLFPIALEHGQLVVATGNPFNLYPLDEVSAHTGLSVVPVLASRDEIAKLIKKHFGVGSETVEGLMASQEDDVELLEELDIDGSELSEMAQEASVVKLVNEILLEAIESRASDVHIEAQNEGVTIRYRIDGMLHPQPVPPSINRFHPAIISRLKIMARLNIAEKRLPQDGRIKLKVRGREVDVRVSIIPMIHGEGIVMRILDKGSMVFELGSLGMEPDVYKKFQKLIALPHGIVLVTGPTGSGKTTSLYSALQEIKNDSNKIITTEDPVEYQLAGINQIQVHTKIGLTFGAALRSILRHDPDIVLVGEIRDLETAENAAQASLTGHMVFSTLHTNDAAGAFTRMVDMGVEPFLVASTVEAVMAQRLVRKLCPDCKEEYTPDLCDLPDDFPFAQLAAQGNRLFRPKGCRKCRQVGYSGRLGLYELLVTSNRIRDLAHHRASTWEVKKAAVEEGMSTLRDDGWIKALAGKTSVEEVLRVTKGDQVLTRNQETTDQHNGTDEPNPSRSLEKESTDNG